MTIQDYDRIEGAIHYLERHAAHQPSLGEVARAVGLSEFYFQRLFRRWAGVSPKRFLQYLTIEHAKHALRQGRSVLATSYETGLSGPSRLHDLFLAVEAMTPGAYKELGRDLTIRFGFGATPFGTCLVAATDRGICALEFLLDEQRDATVERLERTWRAATLTEDPAAVDRYLGRIFAGESADKPLTLVLRGTNFQVKVWEALLRVPEGAATTYGDLAAAVGQPEAAHAVGTAVGQNRIAYLIPCHRVLRKTGALGGYRWGTTRKQAMLGWEAARQERARLQVIG